VLYPRDVNPNAAIPEAGLYTIVSMLTYANRSEEAGQRAGIAHPKDFDARR